MISRRQLFDALLLPALSAGETGAAQLDRRALVRRHSPVFHAPDPAAPLSVGNGELAFTADITGLQTFAGLYEKTVPLCTQSQWGWHSFPPPNGQRPDDLKLEMYDTYGRPVGYPTRSEGQKELYQWLRENPHRLHLGRIAFELPDPAEVTRCRQRLDLWTGILESRFTHQGVERLVHTCCHPHVDAIAASVEPPLPVFVEFPYGSPNMNAADWKSPARHRTVVLREFARGIDLRRELDGDSYRVILRWEGDAGLRRDGPHRFTLVPRSTPFAFTCCFTPGSELAAPTPRECFDASEKHWAAFWSKGGAIDLSGSRDPRAAELERRVVLSQYLTAIQCSGSLPPQETGLTCNSWYGKFHLEMHWWHAAHFALWGRAPMLERSLGWYRKILEAARDLAKRQGYRGARWPKMVGPEGRDSPSPVGPLLIWQQPHFMAMAELCYLAEPKKETLDRYGDEVMESAEFMASFAVLDPKRSRYVLGPPLIPAQENHPPRETWNPTFELVYWRHGLEIAQRWRERMGLKRNPEWDKVASHLSPLPVKDGVYLAHENCPQTFTERNRDHPSMLAALGVLPGQGVDREVMRNTLKRVLREWRWDDTWGWDFPMTAMTATRLNEPRLAIEALFIRSPKNTWLPNGHNWQRPNLPLYLPGNGGLLAAVALMAAGWRNGPREPHPGFPKDAWTIRWEGLRPLL